MTSHECPSPSCSIRVPDSMFACRAHWFKISAPTRRAIYATRGLPLTDDTRWAIIQDAIDELSAA